MDFYFVGTRHGTSLQGGILDGVYDNWYFLWDDVHIVPTSEWEIFPSLGGARRAGDFVAKERK